MGSVTALRSANRHFLPGKPAWSQSAACALLLALALAGCSKPAQVVEPPPRVYHVEPGILRSIDDEILVASEFARHEAKAFARITMDEWRDRVRRRIEEVFIPWYADYWTQQWLAVRVAWYRMGHTEGEPEAERRLADYLQEQFYERVLEPVSAFVDPRTVMEDTTTRYLRELRYRLDPLPFEHAVPAEAFNQHLDAIPAIVLPGDPRLEASLHDILNAADRTALPAYARLLEQIAVVKEKPGQGPLPDRLHAVAGNAVTRLLDSLAVRGGATAASTVVGGVWGMVITLGTGVWGALEHDRDRPVIEAQLRANLDAALAVMWRELVEDSAGGVSAVVHHMSSRIESTLTPPARPAPRPAPLPGELF